MKRVYFLLIIVIISCLLAVEYNYKINRDKCIGCRLCVSACPVNAISMKHGKTIIDDEICIDCGICFNGNNSNYKGCPVSAIERDKFVQNQPTENENVRKENDTEDISLKKYVVTENICIGCNLCVLNCPVKAITMQNKTAVIDTVKCIGCGICVNGNGENFSGCPVRAIIEENNPEQ
ncbi:MAG: 4Fe-4S binding protein [Candidatus Cloacimonetes bacterium]|nr:4Fe-4S binding protein [Candidatus Cloacimonadota bacterium]